MKPGNRLAKLGEQPTRCQIRRAYHARKMRVKVLINSSHQEECSCLWVQKEARSPLDSERTDGD